MAADARVSLVAYVYNYADYLGEVLRSVQAQSCSSFELVVVDDGSTDGTADVVRSLSDPRIRLVQQAHRGRAHLDETFNRCMAEARGDLIAVVNGDDPLHPRKIEGQVALFTERPELDVSFHDAAFVDAAGRSRPGSFRPWVDAWTLESGRLGPYQFRQNVIPNPTVMFRRRVWDRLGAQQFGWVHDYDFWLRAAVAGLRFHFSDERWIRYRVHARSHSNSAERAERIREESSRMRRSRRAQLSIEQLYPEIARCRAPEVARAEAHAELAVLLASGEAPLLDLAARELERALECVPGYALAEHDLAIVELLSGAAERGLARLRAVVDATGAPVARENWTRARRRDAAEADLVLVAPDPETSELLQRRRCAGAPPVPPPFPAESAEAATELRRLQRLAVDALLHG